MTNLTNRVIINEGSITGRLTQSGRVKAPYVKYPFSFMEEKDFFDVTLARASQAKGAAFQWGKRNGAKFVTQTIHHESTREPVGARIIRVE